MKIVSPVFDHGETIPVKYTCDGANISPPLLLAGPPAETQSLALIVDDPDSPSGDFTHWLVWNIPPGVERIEEGRLPEGVVEGLTDFGRGGYGGPCPVGGEHRYFFKLFALDIILDLSPLSEKSALLRAMRGHILSQAEFMGKYRRSES